jgi:integrase
MSKVIIAKQPNLTFLATSRRTEQKNNCPLPIIFNSSGCFDWDANSYITDYSGGSQTYNIKPLAGTSVKRAYSLNLFCSFLEDKSTKLYEINNSSLYKFIDSLKERGINDDTIISHGRVALDYINHISKIYPEFCLSTCENDPIKKYKVHYTNKTFKIMGREYKYLHHRSFDGLIHISAEAEYVHDYEYIQWMDAIHCTTYHPRLDEYIISRWQALSTLLEITGSRISEIHKITKTMIINSAKNILDSDNKKIIRNIPITKGKYKGKTRNVKTTSEDIQIVLMYLKLTEKKYPNIKHDYIFVDLHSGEPLKASYLKNYTKKVINGSKYCRKLRHLTNHSFRHRFITLNIAKAIKKMSASGSFSNILSVASTACRKLTMHASNSSMANYVHLASEYIEESDQSDFSEFSSHIRSRISKMILITKSLQSKAINDKEALDSLVYTVNELMGLHIV